MFASKVLRFSSCLSTAIPKYNIYNIKSKSYFAIYDYLLKSPRSIVNLQNFRHASSASKSIKDTILSSDVELIDFLNDEIKLEKENDKKLGNIKGFEITKFDGPKVVLTKKIANETITVKFNVNNSVEDAVMPAVEASEQTDPEMVSRPALVIEINKGGENSLALHCTFPTPEEHMPTEQTQEYEDLLEIQNVTIIKKSEEWSENMYSLNGSIMDGNLYDMLLKMLEERGIDGDFVEDVIDWSTTYEHQKYVGLLQQIKDFVSNK